MPTINTAKLDPIPTEAHQKIIDLLDSGKLFRYCSLDPEESYVSMLERDFAQYLGAKYALALNSCSSAIFLSLVALWIWEGDEVIIPGFTFTAVPSCVVHAGARPIIAECKENLCIDPEDLKKKITPRTKALLLSYMRGHFDNIDEIITICKDRGIHVIEDAANALGAKWDGKFLGTFGKTGCFSFQSYKLLNGGEGWVLVTDDDELFAKVLLLSGSYETMWKSHFLKSTKMQEYQKHIPTYNLRMSSLTGLVVLAQVPYIDERVKEYNDRYTLLSNILASSKEVYIPVRNNRAEVVAETIQFSLNEFSVGEIREFVRIVNGEGIWVRAFGADPENMRCFWNWLYIGDIPELPRTRMLLEKTCEIRLALSCTRQDIEQIGAVILSTITSVKS